MSEKIKISVPEKILELLRKDAKDFRVLKPSKEENLNAFINTLIMNFYERFAFDDEKFRDKVRGALSSLPDKYFEETYLSVINAITKNEKDEDNFGKNVAISFKPTKISEPIIIYIENALLKNEAISSFYRRLFIAYAKKLKNEREKIIHKQSYETLTKAMKKGVQVCISLDNGMVYNHVSVYSVAQARDELFNYALLYSDKKNRTVRLAKIKSVLLLAESAQVPEASKKLFDRQIIAGAQYPMYSTDDEPIKVQLSEKGRELFDKIYLYRPVPTSVDGDIYTFDCSAGQVLYYFERFGENAVILSPKRIGIFMRNYYYFALKKYRSVYGKER